MTLYSITCMNPECRHHSLTTIYMEEKTCRLCGQTMRQGFIHSDERYGVGAERKEGGLSQWGSPETQKKEGVIDTRPLGKTEQSLGDSECGSGGLIAPVGKSRTPTQPPHKEKEDSK